jgi:hypothetical protein
LRPQYENEGDRQAEVKIMERVAKALGFSDFRKLPASYVLDFAAIRGNQVTGFVEVKRRHNKMSQYPDIFVALHKLNAAKQLSMIGKKTIFAVEWDDCTGWLLLEDPSHISFTGRVDRNDPADLEPMAHFPIDRVKII